VKVVFQDVDGCMNTPDATDLSSGPEGGLTEQQAELLGEIGRAIDASPVEAVVLNTGRTHSAVGYIADALASRKTRYWLTEHGAYGYDSQTGEWLDLPALCEAAGRFELAERYASLSRIAALVDWYQRHGVPRLEERFGVRLPALPKAANLTVGVPEQLPPAQLIAAIEDLLVESPDVDERGLVYHYNDYYVDVVSQVGKGDGALLLLDLLGVAVEDALAAGDGLNDQSMFEVLARGFCPANAAPPLKDLCREKGGVVSDHAYGAGTLDLYRRIR
jgi:hydroxymethylpyrimidine pyrophosphatase-like HAD family hydrolase